MNTVIEKMPIKINAGETQTIELNDIFLVDSCVLTIFTTKGKGNISIKITNNVPNSVEVNIHFQELMTRPIAFKPLSDIFDVNSEEFIFVELTPDSDFEGHFSWVKDCLRDFVSMNSI